MRKNWWHYLGQHLAGFKRGMMRRFRRTYIPMTTPEEVTVANQLSRHLPSDLALYLYVAAQANTAALVYSGLLLEHEMPAQQLAQVERTIENQEVGELMAIKAGLALCPRDVRPLVSVTVITENARLARAFSDFSIAKAQLNPNQQPITREEQVAFEVLTLLDDYRQVFFTQAMQMDEAKLALLKQKNKRILEAVSQSS